VSRTVSIDFSIVPPEKAVVSVMDRSFLYGDSVYEVIHAYPGGALFLLDRHYRRLLRSAGRIDLSVPFAEAELRDHLGACVRASGLDAAYVRVVVSRGTDTRFGLLPPAGLRATTVCFVDRLPEIPKSWYEEGIEVSLVSVMRNPRESLDPNIKTGNYLNNMMAAMEAQKSGASDAIMLNARGNVTEGTTSNVFIVKGGAVVTPEVDSGLLEGVTREFLRELCGREGVPFVERAIPKDEFLGADEIFITGTIKELVPVKSVSRRPVGDGRPGPVTRRLMSLFKSEIDRIVRPAR
jgi:branched-chain amino acid aminotransferase